jgi:hypothetical protein
MNAPKDQNNVSVRLGTSSSDGVTTLPIQADPTAHWIKTSDATTGSNVSANSIAPRDGNNVPAMLAVSSVDGKTPVQLYVDGSGNLLVDSN